MVIILVTITFLKWAISFSQHLTWPEASQAFFLFSICLWFWGIWALIPQWAAENPVQMLEHRAVYCSLCSECAGPERTLSPRQGQLAVAPAQGHQQDQEWPGQLQPALTVTCQGRNLGTQGFAYIDPIRKRKREKKWTFLRHLTVHANDCTNSPVLVTANPAFWGKTRLVPQLGPQRPQAFPNSSTEHKTGWAVASHQNRNKKCYKASGPWVLIEQSLLMSF